MCFYNGIVEIKGQLGCLISAFRPRKTTKKVGSLEQISGV